MATPTKPTTNNVLNTVPGKDRIVATNEKVTGPAAVAMLKSSNLEKVPRNQLEILDNACGGGVLSAEVMNLFGSQDGENQIKRIVASDNDEYMLEYTRKRKAEKGWTNVEVRHADQQSLPFSNDSFSHVFCNFGVFFCRDPAQALSETMRVLRPGGIAGFTSWKVITWWSTLAAPAIAKYIPEAPELPNPSTLFPKQGWSDPDDIPEKLQAVGFKDIQIEEVSFGVDVELEEFAEACAVLSKAVTARCWSKEICDTCNPKIEPAFVRYLGENFKDGKWDGKMKAIVSLGVKA